MNTNIIKVKNYLTDDDAFVNVSQIKLIERWYGSEEYRNPSFRPYTTKNSPIRYMIWLSNDLRVEIDEEDLNKITN